MTALVFKELSVFGIKKVSFTKLVISETRIWGRETRIESKSSDVVLKNAAMSMDKTTLSNQSGSII
jgi:hypothetical protein